MIQGERNPPARQPAREGSAACDAARSRMRAFLSGDRPLAADRALRAHLDRCENCNQHYRESLLIAARVGRERRLLAERREREFDLALHHLEGDDDVGRSKKMRRMRAMVLPFAVLVALGAMFASTGAPSKLAIQLAKGRATVGARDLDVHAPSRSVERGEWLTTFEDSEVALATDETRVTLGPNSRILVEDPKDLRFRLERGTLDVAGPCRICGSFGVVEVEKGSAGFSIREDRLVVDNRDAELRAVNAAGEHMLERGRRSELLLARR